MFRRQTKGILHEITCTCLCRENLKGKLLLKAAHINAERINLIETKIDKIQGAM